MSCARWTVRGRARFVGMPVIRRPNRDPLPETHFLTFSCVGRARLLADPRARDIVVEQFRRDACTRDIALHAWVVMSNHVHVLATEAELPVRQWCARAKQRTAFAIRRLAPCAEPAAVHGAFWLRGGGFDRHIWSWQEFKEKRRYIHENPVSAGLCDRPSAWPWSSAAAPVATDALTPAPPPVGLVDLDWWVPAHSRHEDDF